MGRNPQRRKRVFWICLRKDLAFPSGYTQTDMFTQVPKLELNFNFEEVPFGVIEEAEAVEGEYSVMPRIKKLYPLVKYGKSASTRHPATTTVLIFTRGSTRKRLQELL